MEKFNEKDTKITEKDNEKEIAKNTKAKEVIKDDKDLEQVSGGVAFESHGWL